MKFRASDNSKGNVVYTKTCFVNFWNLSNHNFIAKLIIISGKYYVRIHSSFSIGL